MNEVFPRALTEREREILDFLLAADSAGFSALREQAPAAIAVRRCPCGCATIDLEVDRASVRPMTPRSSPVSEAITRDGRPPAELLLFLDDGWLSSVELVWYERHLREFPPPEEFEPARAR